MRTALRPLLRVARSIMGTEQILGRGTALEAKLDALLERTSPGRVPVQTAEPEVPPTKMESAMALLTYADLTGVPPPVTEPAIHGGGSRLCRQGDYATDAFRYWIGRTGRSPSMHRKLWEWFFIADVLSARGVLRAGSSGLGFGVGTEPLTALFAAHDCRITATDLDSASTQATQMGWIKTNQHASDLSALHYPDICSQEELERSVTFRPMDMNAIPADLTGFDFTWSACSLEHLGSLQHGIDFFVNSVDCLRPGGIAVHTTEFNLSSDTDTFESKDLSLYRRRDIEQLVSALERKGHSVEPIDWTTGGGVADRYVDLPPYNAPMHLRLRLAEFDCTSIGVVARARS